MSGDGNLFLLKNLTAFYTALDIYISAIRSRRFCHYQPLDRHQDDHRKPCRLQDKVHFLPLKMFTKMSSTVMMSMPSRRKKLKQSLLSPTFGSVADTNVEVIQLLMIMISHGDSFFCHVIPKKHSHVVSCLLIHGICICDFLVPDLPQAWHGYFSPEAFPGHPDNVILLCANCHGGFDDSIPSLVIVPTDLQFFIDFSRVPMQQVRRKLPASLSAESQQSGKKL